MRHLILQGDMHMGKVILIASGKGGTGKSTSTAALACGLAELGKSVVCVDADAELRNLDLYLGLSDAALMDYGDVLEGRCSLEDALTPSRDYPTLSLLAAPVEPPRETAAELIPLLRQTHDYCLLDCPGGLSTATLWAAWADLALIIATPDPCSQRDASRAAQVLSEQGLDHARLIINRVSRRFLRNTAATLDDTIDLVGLQLLGYVPEDAGAVLALAQGRPLLTLSHRGAAAAFRRIARRLDGQNVPLRR